MQEPLARENDCRRADIRKAYDTMGKLTSVLSSFLPSLSCKKDDKNEVNFPIVL